VTVGHVTVDVIAADGSRRPGGGAFYSALQAARLGLRVLILTQGSPPEIEALLEPYRCEELELHVHPAPATTMLRTSWTNGKRSQRVLAWAGPIAGPIAVDTRILHFAPVARETSAAWRGHADFVGLTPQGHARAWTRRDETGGRIDRAAGREVDSAAGRGVDSETRRGVDSETGGEMDDETGAEIFSAPVPADRASLEALLPDGCRAVVVSEQERTACAPLLTAAAQDGAVIAVTAGAGATSVQLPGGQVTRVQTPPVAEPRDDLGAGDVFAAAFFVALHEGLPPEHAAMFGNAAAAIRIAGSGANAIGDRGAIEARVEAGRWVERSRPFPS
jgi:hypothetical protein